MTITLLAFFIKNAASSAEPGRTDLPSEDVAAAGETPSPPKPPSNTLKIERFIPLHMMYERMAPEEPTSAPVITSAGFCKVKPMPAAAQPE